MADANKLSALRAAAAPLPSETMQDRKRAERRSRARDDGRSNRTRQPVEKFSVDLPPGVKARVVAACRRHGVLIKDFALDAIEVGLAKYDAE